MQFLVAVPEKFLVDDGQQSVLYGRACFPYFVQEHDIGCGQIAVDGTFILVGFFQSANAPFSSFFSALKCETPEYQFVVVKLRIVFIIL